MVEMMEEEILALCTGGGNDEAGPHGIGQLGMVVAVVEAVVVKYCRWRCKHIFVYLWIG